MNTQTGIQKIWDVQNAAAVKLQQRIAAEGLPFDIVEEIRKVGWEVNEKLSKIDDEMTVSKSFLKVGDKFPHWNNQQASGQYTIPADTEIDTPNDWCIYLVEKGIVTMVAALELDNYYSLMNGIRQAVAKKLNVEVTSTFHQAFEESYYLGWYDSK